jgi:hypothetical protein
MFSGLEAVSRGPGDSLISSLSRDTLSTNETQEKGNFVFTVCEHEYINMVPFNYRPFCAIA